MSPLPLLQRSFLVIAASIFLGSICPSFVFGHATGETYIWLNPQADCFDGRVELRLADLRKYLKMEIPEDYDAARTAILAKSSELEEYIRKNFKLETIDGEEIPYEIVKTDLLKNEFFGHFAQFFFQTAKMDVPSKIRVTDSLLLEFDKFQRAILCMEYNHFTGESHPERFHHAIFSAWNTVQEVDFNNIVEVRWGRKYFIWEGIRHIWIGLDHILFLITLLLASVLVKREVIDTPDESGGDQLLKSDEADAATKPRKRFEWVPVEGFRGAFWSIFKIVTIFTIAHSITLALASLDIINMPSRLVESIIALSIVLVAINNIIPTFRDRTWVILFLFGLFHGLGFASVMQNLPFRMPNLTRLLVCFNIGVELGQLVIVIAVFPIIFFLRKSKYYKPVILIGGSILMCIIAGYWFIERAFGLE